MPLYNGRQHVADAVVSILEQTYKDFELLVINDGSTDDSREIVQSFDDPRIRIEDNPRNMGVTATLNRGLQLARGTIIARQDADDVSLPDRLRRQIDVLQTNPQTAMVGGWYRVVDSTNEGGRIQRLPELPAHLSWSLLFGNQFMHGLATFRKRVVRALGGYSPSIVFAQDYDLWCRLSRTHALQNVPTVLAHYRRTPKGISVSYEAAQRQSALATSRQQMAWVLGHGHRIKL